MCNSGAIRIGKPDLPAPFFRKCFPLGPGDYRAALRQTHGGEVELASGTHHFITGS